MGVRNFTDYTGEILYGGSKITSIRRWDKDQRRNSWNAICKCGKRFHLLTTRITRNILIKCFSCTKQYYLPQNNSLEGKKFGRLLVIMRSLDVVKYNNKLSATVECVCDCGKLVVVREQSLKDKQTMSCGCWHRERSSKFWINKWNKLLGNKPRRYLNKQNRFATTSLAKYIYKRDNYKCKICSINRNLNAHHIDGWSYSIEKRYDETNLITLCVNHHKEFHKKYGQSNNTKEQFANYLKEYNLNLEIFISQFNMYKNKEKRTWPTLPKSVKLENPL